MKFSKQLVNYFYSLKSKNKLMGSVKITKNGNQVYSNAFGYIDIIKKLPTEIDSKYRIGSITKMFTSVMVLQLIEENRLTFTTKLSKFYPDMPNAEKISILNLLSHKSGLFNLTDDPWHSTTFTKHRTKEKNIELIKSYDPIFEPGEKTQYCNTGYILLGYIIEDVTGKKYDTNLQERICNKIGLGSTYFGAKINPENGESYPYLFEPQMGWRLAPLPNLANIHGAGAVVSNTCELSLFITELFNNKLIDKTLLVEMIKMEDGEGLGIKKLSYIKDVYGHPGNMPGFSSILAYFPEGDVVIAICTNGLNGLVIRDLLRDILEIFYETNI